MWGSPGGFGSSHYSFPCTNVCMWVDFFWKKFLFTGLWSFGQVSGINWIFIELPGAPGTICCGRWLYDRGKMHEPISGDFHSRSIFFFFLLARVLCIEKTRPCSVQLLGWKGAENYFLQLTCELLEAIVAQLLFLFPTSTGFFRVKLFRVIIARQAGDMHLILLQELCTLLSLQHSLLLPSATYGRIMIPRF